MANGLARRFEGNCQIQRHLAGGGPADGFVVPALKLGLTPDRRGVGGDEISIGPQTAKRQKGRAASRRQNDPALQGSGLDPAPNG